MATLTTETAVFKFYKYNDNNTEFTDKVGYIKDNIFTDGSDTANIRADLYAFATAIHEFSDDYFKGDGIKVEMSGYLSS